MPPFPKHLSPSLCIGEHDFMWHEISLWSVRVSCLCVPPPNFSHTTNLLAGRAEWEKGRGPVQGLLSNYQNTSILPTLSVPNPKHHKIQTSTIQATMNRIHPSWPDPIQSPPLMLYHLCHAQVLHYPIHPH